MKRGSVATLPAGHRQGHGIVLGFAGNYPSWSHKQNDMGVGPLKIEMDPSPKISILWTFKGSKQTPSLWCPVLTLSWSAYLDSPSFEMKRQLAAFWLNIPFTAPIYLYTISQRKYQQGNSSDTLIGILNISKIKTSAPRYHFDNNICTLWHNHISICSWAEIISSDSAVIQACQIYFPWQE